MPNAYGRAFTTANFLANLAALKAINFGASDPMGCWFVVPNSSTNNVEIWVWEPTSTATTNEVDVVRPDSVVPGSPGRCLQRLKFDASSLGGILSAIAALNTAGLIERTAEGSAAIVSLSGYVRNFLDDPDAATARSTLGLGTAATRAIGNSTGQIRDAADTAYSNARTPTAHASSHAVGGTDIVPIFGYLAVSTNSTLTTSNQRQLIDVNATSAPITITLPSAATVGSGWAVQIRKSDASANLVTIARSGSDTINGVTSLPLAVQHQSFILFSLGGTSWGVVAGFPGTLPANTLLGRGATAGPPEVISNSNFANLVNGIVPASQLPGYVDDYLEYANLAAFPTTGESGKLYFAIDTNLTYRWTGSTYGVTSTALALGTTLNTAYRGDFGNTAYLHSLLTGNPHGTTKADIGLGNVPDEIPVRLTGNQTINGIKTFNDTTPSTSTTTGALVVLGGVGAAGSVYALNFYGKNLWLLEPRSSSNVINANSITYNQFAGTKWLDGSATNLNVPVNAGMLHQFDSLFGTSGTQDKYRVQEYLTVGTGVNARFWKRTENNGTWGTWLEMSFLNKTQTYTGIQNFTDQININGTKVLGPRETEWTAGVGTPNKGAFNSDTATLIQTAQRVLALEQAFRNHGGIN